MENVKFGQIYSDGLSECFGCCKDLPEGEKVHSQIWNDNGIRHEYLFCKSCTSVICENYDSFKDKPMKQGEVIRVKCDEQEKEIQELKEANEFLEDEAWDILMQSCCADDGEVDSMCMSAYIPSIEYFIKKGRLKEVSRAGRRIIARATKGGES